MHTIDEGNKGFANSIKQKILFENIQTFPDIRNYAIMITLYAIYVT